MGRIRVSSPNSNRTYRGQHRFEHWYVDNAVYFITARCRDRFPAFASEDAKAIFWDRFDHYTAQHGFTPWVTTLLDNHYHTLGYLREGRELGQMMRKFHGSVAKLVNDLLATSGGERRVPFWTDRKDHDYFDGCLRDEKQGRLTYRYVLMQAVRARIARSPESYPHTRANIPLDRAIRRALQLNAFLEGVPYKRYEEAKHQR